ncbi:hypothetical protein [Falsiroseomonas sp. E2-1-a4]
MSVRARFLLLLGLVALSWVAVAVGMALTWVTGRFFASLLGWA